MALGFLLRVDALALREVGANDLVQLIDHLAALVARRKASAQLVRSGLVQDQDHVANAHVSGINAITQSAEDFPATYLVPARDLGDRESTRKTIELDGHASSS